MDRPSEPPSASAHDTVTLGPDPNQALTRLAGHTSPAAVRPLPGHQLGPYRLERMIGRGGMGAVWEAVDTRLGRRVAMKVMLAGANAKPDELERFRREAANAGKLRHPNIVPVHDLGHDQGAEYLVMDLVEGETLAEALRSARLSYRQKAALLERTTRAVAYAHEQGVVHRDLKPSNILLEHRPGGSTASIGTQRLAGAGEADCGEPLVTDFGLAKDMAQDSSLSRTGQTMGTPAYMPPEQAEGRVADTGPRSDVYSLGAILYEMLTGRPPFVGDNAVQVMRAVSLEDPVPPRRIAHDVPRDLETVCLRCLQKRPERRYATAADLADDLAAWLAGEPIRARPPSRLERFARRVRRNPLASVLSAALAAVVVIGSAAYGRSLERTAAATNAAEVEQARREALEAHTASEQRREWRVVFTDDFSDPQRTQSEWDLEDGVIRMVPFRDEVEAGTVHTSRVVRMLLRQPLQGDLRFEWDCRIDSPRLDSVCCTFSEPRGSPGIGAFDSGYTVNLGAYDNSAAFVSRQGTRLTESRASPLTRGRTMHVRVDHIGGRISAWIDGQRVLETVDPEPLVGEGRGTFALCNWGSDMRWSAVRISELTSPLKADPLEMADRYLGISHLATAADLYELALATGGSAERQDRARAGLARCRELIASEGHAAEALATISRSLPNAFCMHGFRVGTVDLTLDPQHRDDLAVLRGMPLGRVNGVEGALPDLAPLSGTATWSLVAVHNHLASLAPLSGLRLEALLADGNDFSDLSPLSGMPLGALHVSSTPVASLEPLRGMPLSQLGIMDTLVSSLEPVATSPIRILVCTRSRIHDLDGVRAMPLFQLFCDSDGITSLEPLRGKRLNTLSCAGNQIRSLEPLAGQRLSWLICADNPVTDLAPLAGMALEHLDCAGDDVADLAPLAGMQLHRLNCSNNPRIVALAPLAGMPLERLDLDGTGVADLAPLAEVRLEELVLTTARVRDLRGFDALRRHPTLKIVSLRAAPGGHRISFPVAEFWRQYDSGQLP
jgi:serine/threonine protein kinase